MDSSQYRGFNTSPLHKSARTEVVAKQLLGSTLQEKRKNNITLCGLEPREVRPFSNTNMATVDKKLNDHIEDGGPVSNEGFTQNEKSEHDGIDEEVDNDAEEEAREKLRREREARAQALTLEIVGDLPFAEVKPPENVLFVCKLNPVTEG